MKNPRTVQQIVVFLQKYFIDCTIVDCTNCTPFRPPLSYGEHGTLMFLGPKKRLEDNDIVWPLASKFGIININFTFTDCTARNCKSHPSVTFHFKDLSTESLQTTEQVVELLSFLMPSMHVTCDLTQNQYPDPEMMQKFSCSV
ncbi:MAG: hypothetical protein JSS82_00240 [Bacteroidetes bacterium]|nr:hypothetical protein [Bacteroidota bacterium]